MKSYLGKMNLTNGLPHLTAHNDDNLMNRHCCEHSRNTQQTTVDTTTGKTKLLVFSCMICFIMLSFAGNFVAFAQTQTVSKNNFPNDKDYFIVKTNPSKTSNYQAKASPTSNSELAKRYLKLGNSYRESGNFELALHYIKTGKQTFSRQRNFDDSYWYAVSLEYLAYCYRDVGNLSKARTLLEQSLEIYRSIINMRQGSQYAVSEVVQNLERELASGKYCDAGRNATLKNNNSGKNIANELQIETFVLNLDNRRLTKFPDDITRKRIDNISISKNRFANFPDEVLVYPSLKVLNVSFNRIRNFPDLSRLQSLEYLNFSDNRITDVDGSIGKLQKLEYLNLANNRQLKNISLEIGKLRNTLKVLDIRNTRIDESLIRQLTRELPNTNIISGNERKRNTNSLDFNSSFGEGF